jgi:hypothetical protein
MVCVLVNASLICIHVSVHSSTRKLGLYVCVCEIGKARFTQDKKNPLSRSPYFDFLLNN